jgi:hypothetical protein
MKKYLSLVFAVVATLMVSARQGIAEQKDLQSWSTIAATINLDCEKDWFLYLESQPRIGDDLSRLERLIVRGGLGFNLTPQMSVLLGYGWTPSFYNTAYDGDFRNENRIWQQFLYREERLGLQWQHRVRLEQRIIQDAGETSHRGRYLIRASHSLSEDGSFGVTVYNELFVNANGASRGPKGGFDRDRFFLGPYVTSGPGRYEIGYIGEYAAHFGAESRWIDAIGVNAMFTF